MLEAMKTPEGKEALKATINKCFPVEIASSMLAVLDGDVKLDKIEIDKLKDNKILDSFNDGKRSEDEMKLLFRGKLSPQEVKSLKAGEKAQRRET